MVLFIKWPLEEEPRRKRRRNGGKVGKREAFCLECEEMQTFTGRICGNCGMEFEAEEYEPRRWEPEECLGSDREGFRSLTDDELESIQPQCQSCGDHVEAGDEYAATPEDEVLCVSCYNDMSDGAPLMSRAAREMVKEMTAMQPFTRGAK